MSLFSSDLLEVLVPIIIAFFSAMTVRKIISQLIYDGEKAKKNPLLDKRLKYKKRGFSATQDASCHQKSSVKEKGFYE